MKYDNPPVVKVISRTRNQVAILCPYCGKRHYHGNVPGHRGSHCIEKTSGDIGYIIPDVQEVMK